MTERTAGEICHTCGSTSNLELVVTCDKCKQLSAHIYCMVIIPHEIPERWCCEECIDHDKASNNPKRNSSLDKLSRKRANLESVPPVKAHVSPQTGKVKFISEREITFLNDRKYISKRSPAHEKMPKLRCMTEIMGLPRDNKKKKGITKDMVEGTSQKNGKFQPEKEKLINLPLPEVVWKGVINYFQVVSQTRGVQVHLAEKASQKVKEIIKGMHQIISMKMKPRLQYWRAFKVQPPSQQDIGIYCFSSESDWNKEKFHRMVERLYASDQVLVGGIGNLGLFLYPSQILPKCNQCVNGECYLWGLIHRFERKVSNQVPVTFRTTTSIKRENHDAASPCSQVKSNDMDIDMEIDMIGGVELNSTLTANNTLQRNLITPPGFPRSHFEFKKPANDVCLKSDMGRLSTSPGSQLSCSELHSAVQIPTTPSPMYVESSRHLRV